MLLFFKTYLEDKLFFFTNTHSFLVISLGVIAPLPKTSPRVESDTDLKDIVYPPNGFFTAIVYSITFLVQRKKS